MPTHTREFMTEVRGFGLSVIILKTTQCIT